MKQLIICLLSLFLCSSIPIESEEKIEKLFHYLFMEEGFAYTLFGSKPMSTTACDKSIIPTSLEMSQHPHFELPLLWKEWEKYASQFPMDAYLFFAKDRERWFEIFLIDKENFTAVVNQHTSLFNLSFGF